MHYNAANYSLGLLVNAPVAQSGDIFERVNFSQAVPNTVIFPGVSGLTFISCNLVNCDVHGNTVESCNVVQVSRCSHLHPEWGLTPCDDDCEHLVDTDTITIDGVLVDTIRYYEDKEVV